MRNAMIAYIDKNGECQFTDGLVSEVLPERFVRLHLHK